MPKPKPAAAADVWTVTARAAVCGRTTGQTITAADLAAYGADPVRLVEVGAITPGTPTTPAVSGATEE